MKNFFIVASLIVLAMGLDAQVYCVRSGAAAGGNGTDWNSAFQSLPSSLVRGATYYIATGDYPRHTFSDAESGASYITIKKAVDTADGHGTSTGWQTAYGTGPAKFSASGTAWPDNDAVFSFESGYYIIDGVTGGGPGSWDSGHGFYLSRSTEGHYIYLRGPNWNKPPMPTYITLQHIDIAGPGKDLYFPNSNGIHQGSNTGLVDNTNYGPAHVTIRYCYLHDFGQGSLPMQTIEGQYYLFEYNYVARNASTSANHGTCWQDWGSDDFTIRYNRFDSIEGTSVLDIKHDNVHYQTNYRWKVYGNIFYWPSSYSGTGLGSQGVFGDARNVDVGWESYGCYNMEFYNNTIYGAVGWNSGVYFPVGSGNLVYNNIWYRCHYGSVYAGMETAPHVSFVAATTTQDYNDFIDSLASNQTKSTNDVVIGASATDSLASAVTDNFALTSNTTAGTKLATEFAYDMLGIQRGTSGLWSRGALEFTSGVSSGTGAGTSITPPSGLHIKTP